MRVAVIAAGLIALCAASWSSLAQERLLTLEITSRERLNLGGGVKFLQMKARVKNGGSINYASVGVLCQAIDQRTKTLIADGGGYLNNADAGGYGYGELVLQGDIPEDATIDCRIRLAR